MSGFIFFTDKSFHFLNNEIYLKKKKNLYLNGLSIQFEHGIHDFITTQEFHRLDNENLEIWVYVCTYGQDAFKHC